MQLFKGNKLSALQQLRQEGAQRARRRATCTRSRRRSGRPRSPSDLRQALVEHRPEPDLQVRRPVGDQRPPAGRRAVRARRQQLHPRLPRATTLADVQPTLIVAGSLNGRSRRRRACIIRPVEQLNVNTNYFLPGKLWRRPRVQGRRLLARRAQRRSISHTGGNATARFPTQASYDANTLRDRRRHRLRGGADARRPHASTTCTNISVYVQDTLTHKRCHVPARRALRPQPRRGAGGRRFRPTRSCPTGCRRSASAASTRASSSTTSRRASA